MAAAAEIEGVFHGNPSGLDHSVVVTGRCLLFRRQDEPTHEYIELKSSIPLVIAWTPREGTTRKP